MKPRHHTLQGICQDVCVNYQSVVEVHRRIRDVVLQENGKVITQNLGTFFCRDVQPRTGVLNGNEWSSEGYFEVGLKGERTERVEGLHNPELTGTSVSMTIPHGASLPGVTSNPVLPFNALEFVGDRSVFGLRSGTSERQLLLPTVLDTVERVDSADLVEGFNNVVISIDQDLGTTQVQVNNELQSIGDLMTVQGTPLRRGDSIPVEVESPVQISFPTELIESIFNGVTFFRFRLQYVFVQPSRLN